MSLRTVILLLSSLVWSLALEVDLDDCSHSPEGLMGCENEIEHKRETEPVKMAPPQHPENNVELATEYMCKEATRAVIHFWPKRGNMFGINIYNQFLVEVYKVDPLTKNLTEILELLSDPSVYYVKTRHLEPNTTYHFSIQFRPSEEDFQPVNVFANEPYTTLADDYELLSAVNQCEVSKFVTVGKDEVRTNFTWKPVPENVCAYEILLLNKNSSFRDQPVHLFSRAQDLYRMEFKGLRFGCLYEIAVYPSTDKAEGDKYWINFTVPTCFTFHGYNYNYCPPSVPENVTVSLEHCVLDIRWLPEEHPPPVYHIVVIPVNPERVNFTVNVTITGDYHHFRTKTASLGEYMHVYVTAHSDAGRSQTFATGVENHCSQLEASDPVGPHGLILPSTTPDANPLPESEGPSTAKAVLITLFSAIAAAATFFCYNLFLAKKICVPATQQEYEMREPLAKDKTVDEEDDSLGSVTTSPQADEYEVERKALALKEAIGEGEFGIVRRAYLVQDNTKREVAVKMLKENASEEDKKQLRLEMEVMKSVGSHSNILCLIGYCSSHHMLLVEYCSIGNLQNYLRDIWQSKNWAKAVYKMNTPETNEQTEKVVSNPLYSKSDLEKKQLNVTICDLISIARQVALGMEYLSSNKVVHRDLAARNILLTSAFTAKISDFGLSRDVYEENMYRHQGVRRLPIKWMAIESLAHHLFTTQSDVWSFGIMLWEIMTLGGCPYPSLHSSEVYKSLQLGERLERPKLCPQKLYEIMYACWDALPHKRPSFTRLVQSLESFLETEGSAEYLQLDEGFFSNPIISTTDQEKNDQPGPSQLTGACNTLEERPEDFLFQQSF